MGKGWLRHLRGQLFCRVPPPSQVSVEFNFLHTGFAMYSSVQEPDAAAAVPTAEPDATTPVPDHPPSEEPQETVINLVKQATGGKVVEGLGKELDARLAKKQCTTNRAPRYLCAGTVPYTLPYNIWLEIVDHIGRRDELRRTCRKLMAIIPAFYCAKVTGSVDLVLFTEFLCSRVAHHLYGVDVCMTRQAERAWIRDERPMSDEVWADFFIASSAFVAALARCADLQVLRMHIPTTEPATVAQLPVRTLDFIWPQGLSSESRDRVVKDFLFTVKNSCSIHTLNIDINANTDDDLCFLGDLGELRELGLKITYCVYPDWDDGDTMMMETMAVLKGNPALCSLTILNDCHGKCDGYGDALATAISELRFSGTIHTLYLDFDGTCITNVGALCLSRLRDSPALCALTLSLRGVPVGRGSNPYLEPQGITNDTVCIIAKILQSHSLHEFRMSICNPDSGWPVLDDTALCAILCYAGACGTLLHLSLDLGSLRIGYTGVHALVQLMNQRQVAVKVSLFDWHSKDDDGLTPLMHAVQKNELDCVNFLSQKHTSAQIISEPYVIAKRNGLTACMTLLLKNKGCAMLCQDSNLCAYTVASWQRRGLYHLLDTSW